LARARVREGVTDNDTVDTPSSFSCPRLQPKGDGVSTVSLSVTGVTAKTLVLDFETRNTGWCKLKSAGAWRYAGDPATEIITLTYHFAGESHPWTPALPYLPLASLAADPAIIFVSHAGFERAIWHHLMVGRYGFLPIPVARWHDTQAACAYFALPLDLERALTVLNLPTAKDKEGRRLV